MEGYKTLKAGQRVQFEKQQVGKGTHAVNITLIETVEAPPPKIESPQATQRTEETQQLATA